MVPFYGWGLTASRLEPLQGGSLLFTTNSLKFMVLISSTSEGWMDESTLEPPSGFEHGTSELGIQCFNQPLGHYSNGLVANYIHHVPYLRNFMAYDDDFWYTCGKWWYLRAFLSFFQNFDFLGKRAKSTPKWKIISHVPCLNNSIAYDHNFWYTCVKWCLQAFSSFFVFNLDFSGC